MRLESLDSSVPPLHGRTFFLNFNRKLLVLNLLLLTGCVSYHDRHYGFGSAELS